ncbi:MAG: acyltransferase family protein, partial [Firmicutes bacterium]|nr:acyltransferase family protein [Bacillota bacterium]
MESVSTGRQRIEKWDIARGILIFLVVLGHFVAYYAEDSQKMQSLFLFIYAFHMPCFLFIDGMFSKKNVDERRYSRIFSYLVLYFFAKILIALTQGVINHRMHFSLLEESGLPWYGLVLFACSLLTVFLKRFSRRWVLCASILLACFVGYDDSISDFLALSRVIVYFPFFFLGYCTGPVQLAH